jgi:hypothetical protein
MCKFGEILFGRIGTWPKLPVRVTSADAEGVDDFRVDHVRESDDLSGVLPHGVELAKVSEGPPLVVHLDPIYETVSAEIYKQAKPTLGQIYVCNYDPILLQNVLKSKIS